MAYAYTSFAVKEPSGPCAFNYTGYFFTVPFDGDGTPFPQLLTALLKKDFIVIHYICFLVTGHSRRPCLFLGMGVIFRDNMQSAATLGLNFISRTRRLNETLPLDVRQNACGRVAHSDDALTDHWPLKFCEHA
jgi:hypothetical protein